MMDGFDGGQEGKVGYHTHSCAIVPEKHRTRIINSLKSEDGDSRLAQKRKRIRLRALLIGDQGCAESFLTNRQSGGLIACIGRLIGSDNSFMIRKRGRHSRMGFRGKKFELRMKLKAACHMMRATEMQMSPTMRTGATGQNLWTNNRYTGRI